MLKKPLINFWLRLANKPRLNRWDRLRLWPYQIYRRLKQYFRQSANPAVSHLYLRTKRAIRTTSGGHFTFVSLEELLAWTDDWLKSFPERYDLVVGVPRSGLLLASIIACKLGRPLAASDDEANNYWCSQLIEPPLIKRILLIDDSVSSGRTISAARERLQAIWGPAVTITTAALIVSPEGAGQVDCFYRAIPRPRLFEWNMMHSHKGQIVAVDFDGVLCAAPPPGIELDDTNYCHWLETVNPYLIPSFTIDAIITNRLDKYRDVTKRWLERQGVKYRQLLMWSPAKFGAKRTGSLTRHKITSLILIKPDIYWESDYREGEAIWRSTKIPTLCLDRKILLS